MRKLFKKSLACVLAVALCLTAMVGVMVVSADVTGTLEVVAKNGVAGEEGYVPYVTATFTAPVVDGVQELISEAFIAVAVEDAKVVDVTLEDGSKGNEATGYAVALNDAKNIFNIKSNGGVDTAKVKIVIDAAEVGSYKVTLTDVTSATDSQQLIKFATTEATVVIAAPHVHNYVGTETKAATCEEDGVKTFACECGVGTYTEAIPALGHAYDEGVVTTAPDCDDAGVKTFTCSRCNDTYTKAIDALGHTPGEPAEENRVEAKPGVAGSYDMVVRCTVCNAELSKTTHEIPALPEDVCEHEWSDWVVTTHPAKANNYTAIKEHTCTLCNETESSTLTEDVLFTGLEADYSKTSFVYNYDCSAEFVSLMSSVKNMNRKFYIVFDIVQGGKSNENPIEIPTSTYVVSKSMVGFSFENMNCDMKVFLRLTYEENGETVAVDSEKYTFNMVNYMVEQYENGDLSEADAAKVAKDIAFNNILTANTSKTFDVSVNNDNTGTYTTYFSGLKINLYSGTLAYNFDNRESGSSDTAFIKLFKDKNPSNNANVETRTFYINFMFDGSLLSFAEQKVVTYKNGSTLVGLNSSGMCKDSQFSATLTWTGTDSGSETSNPATFNILDSLSASDDELAVAFVEYMNSLS